MQRMMLVLVLLVMSIGMFGCTREILEEPITEPETVDEETYYDMDVYVDPERREMSVQGTITWYNYIGDLDFLYLNVYANASELPGTSNNIQIDSLEVEDYDVTYAIDEEVPTVLRIDSTTTIAEGEVITIQYDMTFKFWNQDRLFGDSDYVNGMFFYPFVAKYTDDWNIEPYTFSGESYFNDIGNYDVTINVPSDFLIACGGKRVDVELAEGRRIERFTLNDARDFSFATSKYYTMYMETFDGVDYYIYSVRELTQEEMIHSFQYLTQSVLVFEEGLGEYPYDHFTLEYGFIYGMESAGIAYVSHNISEETVVHEVAHQWFFNMVGNDQYDESFLDEALVSFIVAYYYESISGVNGFFGYLQSRNSLQDGFKPYYEAAVGVDLRANVDELGDDYAIAIYYHGPTLFKIYLSQFMDNDYEAFFDIVQVYFDEYKGSTATIDDFLAILERESGNPGTIDWFNEQLSSMQNPLE